jgi:2'-5' RNA ligase
VSEIEGRYIVMNSGAVYTYLMERMTQKYTIVQLLEDRQEGDEYAPSDWPLHVTLSDIFAIDHDINDVFLQLAELLSTIKPTDVTAGHDAYFGADKRTQVTLLAMNEELIALHQDVIALLKCNGATFNTPQYIETGFRAHATVRPHARLYYGDKVRFDALSVIDLFPDKNPNKRKILKTFFLQNH